MTGKQSEYISLAQLCEMLSISSATGRNWVRLGKITPQRREDGKLLFEKRYAAQIKRSLVRGSNTALRSRRNKTFASGRNMYRSYVSENAAAQEEAAELLRKIEAVGSKRKGTGKTQTVLSEMQICALLAECAVQMLYPELKKEGSCGSSLRAFMEGKLPFQERAFLIDDLIRKHRSAMTGFIEKNPELFNIRYTYEAGEDLLGLIYISLKNLSARKATGAYYTPTQIVKKLCGKLFAMHDPAGKTIFDPCCGTGNFLIQLPETVGIEQIYGNDTDYISTCITRINLAVRFQAYDRKFLYEHVTNRNYLNTETVRKYDFIIGNPPWGYAFTKEECKKLRKRYRTAGTKPESYDVCVEQALRDLPHGGVLSFVVPEAILSSRSHLAIREAIRENFRFEYLAYLGNVFHGVNCPSIIFQMKRKEEKDKAFLTTGMQVEMPGRQFVIGEERNAGAVYFSFQVSDEEYAVLRKIGDPRGKVYLKGQSDFALGIVTGDNTGMISECRTEYNEPVLRGSDIQKFRCKAASEYMEYDPGKMQQSAPEKYYRAKEKLVYRFINKELVFAYDDRQTLSLNSCNILIPHIADMEMKYILAVLNSRAAQYYFEKTFHSVKVLRSHLEQIPIPEADAAMQALIVKDTEILISGSSAETGDAELQEVYDRMDKKIAHLYGLSEEEYGFIMK